MDSYKKYLHFLSYVRILSIFIVSRFPNDKVTNNFGSSSENVKYDFEEYDATSIRAAVTFLV